MDSSPSRRTRAETTLGDGAERARRIISTQEIYVPAAMKTGRVMVKDEDVCLHCGLCAERCPTGAWDMKKFYFETAKAHTCSR